MNRSCTLCNIKIDGNNHLKDRTTWKSYYNRSRRKNKNIHTLIQNQQSKTDHNNDKDNITNVSTNENHRNVIIGPSNVGRTFYMLKILEKMGNKRPILLITRSPNQYPN